MYFMPYGPYQLIFLHSFGNCYFMLLSIHFLHYYYDNVDELLHALHSCVLFCFGPITLFAQVSRTEYHAYALVRQHLALPHTLTVHCARTERVFRTRYTAFTILHFTHDNFYTTLLVVQYLYRATVRHATSVQLDCGRHLVCTVTATMLLE